MDRVLVVEDDQIMRNLLVLALSRSGYDVIEAKDGDEGFRKAREEKPDLIITDLIMPVKNGYELASDLRNNPITASIPIMMMTGLDEEQDELKAFQEDVDEYIIKPVKISVLRSRIAILLNRGRALRGEKNTESPSPPEP